MERVRGRGGIWKLDARKHRKPLPVFRRVGTT